MSRAISKHKAVKILLLVFCAAVIAAFILSHCEIGFELQIGDPIAVAEKSGTLNSLQWGYIQFPRLYRSEGNSIVCKIANKPDSIEAYDGEYLYYVSSDQGNTWNATNDNLNDFSLLMSNGRYFQGPVLKSAYDSDLLDKYEPDYSNDSGSLYLVDGTKISTDDYDFNFECTEYDPISMEEITFNAGFIWPHMPIRIRNGKTCPAGMPLYHFNMHNPGAIIQEEDGSLFLAAYSEGFNSDDGSIEYGGHYNVYFFRTNDCARTWQYVSQINTTLDYCDDTHDGFCEPCIIELFNGDYYVLMRTGSGEPLYCAYSHDKGMTWDDLQQFSNAGVAPVLLQLDCGITLASYGRPYTYIKWSDDTSLTNWSQQIRIFGEGPNTTKTDLFKQTCGYTSMIALDEKNALLAYSEFEYPDGEGSETIVKKIIVRRITIKYKLSWGK